MTDKLIERQLSIMIESEQDYRLAIIHSPKRIIWSCRIKNENYKMSCFLKRKSSYLVS